MTTGKELRVQLRHARGLMYCGRGTRAWCERHGLSYRDLVVGDGIPAGQLLATGDAMAIRAVRAAQEEAARLEAQRKGEA